MRRPQSPFSGKTWRSYVIQHEKRSAFQMRLSTRSEYLSGLDLDCKRPAEARDWALAANGVVVDLSSSRMRLRLRGDATRLLAAMVAIDFGAARSTGFVASIIHGIPVTILRAAGGFDLLVPRSFSVSLLDWIEDAAKGLREPLGSTA